VQHVSSADRIAVDRGDDRLGQFPDQPVQRLDLEQARLGRPVVTGPGPTRTQLLRQMTAEGGEKLLDALVRAVPMRRLGEPEDVAAAVTFFASDSARFITGQTLSVSGGLTMA
jgi:NAD(P)-dependent dehydrogenase (short-subunit alcohol dehydrogenase family)